MSGYFRSLLAEVLPGWAFWRSSRRPTQPLEGQPLGKGLEPGAIQKSAEPAAPENKADQPPLDPDSENRRL